MTLIEKMEKESKFEDVSEIIDAERILKEFKHLYCKHVFDALGGHFKDIYNSQSNYVKRLKEEYKEKYGKA